MTRRNQIEATRRDILFRAAPAAAMTGLIAATAKAETPSAAPPLDLEALIDLEGDALWSAVRSQFELRQGYLPFNAANMAPPCAGTRQALAHGTQEIDADPSFENRAKYRPMHELTRGKLARLLRVDGDDIALTRNTTESNNTIVNGLDLGPDDEVVLWAQNHRTNLQSWQVRAAREGFTVKLVETPEQPKSDDDLLQPFREALTDRTRILSFSHVSNNSGTALPAHELCWMAEERDILSMVDGAQTVGAMALDLSELECAIYTSSGQKWICGPREAGLLYLRPDVQDMLNTNMVGYALVGSDEYARKFETLGQRDDAAVVGLGAAADLHNAIGPDRVEDRVRRNAIVLMERIQARVPGVEFVTPTDPAHRLGVVIAKLGSVDSSKAQAQVYERHGISAAAFPGRCDYVHISTIPMQI